MTKTEPELLEMLVDPAYSGPNNSYKPVQEKLFNLLGSVEHFGDELGESILKWLGTYLIPGSPLLLPCPADLDLLIILPDIFNFLPARALLQFLEEGKSMLEKTLLNVKAAAPERSEWIGELERRRAGLDSFMDRATHNAKNEEYEIANGYEDSERIFCPICNKRFGDYSYYCNHYVGSRIDGYMFSWMNETPHFFDEVDQLNRTINRPKTEDAIFKVLLEEAPAYIGELFKEVRESGFTCWIYQYGVQAIDSYTNGCGSSSCSNLYFHNNPTEFASSFRTEILQALDWLEDHHPEILVKRSHFEDYYEDNYRGGYEEDDPFEDSEEGYKEDDA